MWQISIAVLSQDEEKQVGNNKVLVHCNVDGGNQESQCHCLIAPHLFEVTMRLLVGKS